MEFIAASFEIIEQEPGISGIYKAAELPGRICYGSQDKIKEGSAELFVKGLMKSNHGAPLEHGTVYLLANTEYDFYVLEFYLGNPYSKCKYFDGKLYITTNLRVLFENNRLDDLKYFCEPTEYHEKRIQVKFNVDRFTGEEFLRHRVASFNRESTRYITYTKEKFGGGSITYIIPVWLLEDTPVINQYKDYNITDYFAPIEKFEQGEDSMNDVMVWMFALKSCEWSYNTLINKYNWKAEEARTVLPCAIKSPLIKTAFISDWKHFFDLRAIGTTGKPHPQAKELAEPLMEEFKRRSLL
jgi:thymidylate synthase (FAD)